MSLEAKTPNPFTLQGHNILIVDDTPVNLGVIVSYLESYGFGIRIARSGETALKRVQYDPPDLILLDILMPGMDGFETCRQLKALEATRDIPVIFMTSLTGTEDKVKGFEVGAVDYVTKPLHQEEVLARVKTHLQLRDLAQSLQDQKSQLEISSRVEKARLFEAVTQQREQLRTLTARLTEIQETERKELARELHDEMGQSLTAISMNLAAITQELSKECGLPVRDRLAEAKLLTDQTLDQIREISLNLRPSMLDDLGLAPTLRWYMNRYAARTGLETEFKVLNLPERLAPEVETALYRITQEGLTNVARHAQARKVSIRLEQFGKMVQVVIQDDGRGFDVDAVLYRKLPDHGAGLLGIRERATLLGGDFDIQAQPGHGARLSIVIPLSSKL